MGPPSDLYYKFGLLSRASMADKKLELLLGARESTFMRPATWRAASHSSYSNLSRLFVVAARISRLAYIQRLRVCRRRRRKLLLLSLCLSQRAPLILALYCRHATTTTTTTTTDQQCSLSIGNQTTDLFREPPNEFKPIISSLYMRVFENGSLVIYNAQRSDAGYYLCQASNGVGAGLSRVIKLTVHGE